MNFTVEKDFVLLGSLLKLCDFIDSAGQAKYAVKELNITVNNEKEDRRGRKLYPGDIVVIEGKRIQIVK